jgi:cysteine-rich repeat protein
VVASDGFLTAVDESDADVTIPQKAPRVAILAPTGTRPIVGAQAAVLRGAARDVEDGRLPDTALRWSSDLNGNLGTGGTVILAGSVLVPGTHVLTLTATDSDALTGTATVPLVVVRQGPICGDGTVDPGEACDDGNILGADECSADCLTSTAGSTTTTIGGVGATTTTLPSSSCAGGCEDGDPCTENGCVAGVGCVSAARTGLAGATCRCAQPPPVECGGTATPKALSRPVAQACGTLAKLGTATGKAAKKLGRRATAQLKKAASVATKLGKRKLPRACADAWRARLVEASRQLATP